MATGLKVGGDVSKSRLCTASVSRATSWTTTGIVRWLNPAAMRLLGDIRGRHYTSVIAPEDRPGARERFAQKMLGTAPASEATGHLVSSGARMPVEVSSVSIKDGERVVGVFGLIDERPDVTATAPHPDLTPRQVEVLRLLEQGTLDEADRRRASSEHRDSQEPCPPPLSGARRQLATRSRCRRPGPDVSLNYRRCPTRVLRPQASSRFFVRGVDEGAVVRLDHPDRCAHDSGQFERRDPGSERV